MKNGAIWCILSVPTYIKHHLLKQIFFNAIVHVILKTKSMLNKYIFFKLLSCITHSMLYMYSNITNSK